MAEPTAPLADQAAKPPNVVEAAYAQWIKDQTGVEKISARTVALATRLQSRWRKTEVYAAAVEARDADKIAAEEKAAAERKAKAAEKVNKLREELAKAEAEAGIAVVEPTPPIKVAPPSEGPRPTLSVVQAPTVTPHEVLTSEVITDGEDDFDDDDQPVAVQSDPDAITTIETRESDDGFVTMGGVPADDDDDDFELPGDEAQAITSAAATGIVSAAEGLDDDQDDDDF